MSPGRLRGSVAIVTGSATGIGFEIAARFCREDAAVALVDISVSVHDAWRRVVADGGNAIAVVADVTDSDAVASLVRRVTVELGDINCLVNNAYSAAGECVVSTTDEQWNSTLAGVVTSAFLCCREVLPLMIRKRRGSIVNIASINALRFGGHDAYSAGKAAMLSLTRNIAARHGKDGIRSNAIVPGTVVTSSWDARVAANPNILEQLLPYYPIGRLGTPSDIASAAVFLSSDEASWITGAELPVDGGCLIANSDLFRLAETSTESREPRVGWGQKTS